MIKKSRLPRKKKKLAKKMAKSHPITLSFDLDKIINSLKFRRSDLSGTLSLFQPSEYSGIGAVPTIFIEVKKPD